jgi:hypothetical protein
LGDAFFFERIEARITAAVPPAKLRHDGRGVQICLQADGAATDNEKFI